MTHMKCYQDHNVIMDQEQVAQLQYVYHLVYFSFMRQKSKMKQILYINFNSKHTNCNEVRNYSEILHWNNRVFNVVAKAN
jgi:hypothetical protein